MAAKGYTQQTLDQIRVLPFSAESLLKFVVQKREAMTTLNVQSAPDLSAAIMQREGSAGEIAVPLVASNLLVGGALIDVTHQQWLTRVDLLKDVADVTASIIANSILFGRSEYERERLSTLYKTSCALSSSVLNMGDVLQIASDTALVLGNTTNCAILLYDSQAQSFRLGAFKGLDGANLHEFDLGARDTIAGVCLRSGRSEYIGEGAREPYGLPRATSGAPFASVVALPMIMENKPIGVIEVFSTDSRAFHHEQIELLESLSQQVATALHVALTHESAAAQSTLDAHTRLFNRMYFEEALVKEVERSTRHRHQLGLMLVDIDHLAQINAHLGEEKGDEAIRYVAATIKSTLREIDIACRFGGQEMAVILPETSQAHTMEVAQRLRQAIRFQPAPGVGVITVSIGVCSFPDCAENAQALLKGAQQALDVAKYEGRDRVREAETSEHVVAGQIPWDELANRAKLSVIGERQANLHLQSRLSIAPEYAAWMTRMPQLVKKKSTDQNTPE